MRLPHQSANGYSASVVRVVWIDAATPQRPTSGVVLGCNPVSFGWRGFSSSAASAARIPPAWPCRLDDKHRA